jgi:uncharacterized protein (DUF488 family)
MPGTLWTIGHSTRDLESFIALLKSERIALLADVRRFPGSRRHPHFNAESLAAALRQYGIAYRHFSALGGRRHKRMKNSPNTAWRVEGFNAYADYMATSEFATALSELESAAIDARTSIMCSEAVPWRCHRRLISDALVVRGWTVLDITGPGKMDPHRLTEFARIDGDKVIYPAEPLFGGGPLE